MELDHILSEEEAKAYREHVAARVERLLEAVSDESIFPELKSLLDDRKWREKIEELIGSIEAGKPDPPTQLHHLLHYLDPNTEDQWRIELSVFEARLQNLRETSLRQKKAKLYKSTYRQIIVDNANQFHSSIFEIAILNALLSSFPNTEIYAPVGEGNQDVEARLNIDGRDIYCDCVIRGYSSSIDNRQGAINPYLAPVKMISATLGKKYGEGGQLAAIANEHPSVLFTCVGFDAYDHYYPIEMKKRLPLTPCSLAIVFDRYICRWFDIFINANSPHPLNTTEIESIITSMVQHLPSRHRATHFAPE